jgi:hypothetical protein
LETHPYPAECDPDLLEIPVQELLEELLLTFETSRAGCYASMLAFRPQACCEVHKRSCSGLVVLASSLEPTMQRCISKYQPGIWLPAMGTRDAQQYNGRRNYVQSARLG